jgi:hypothetical protein
VRSECKYIIAALWNKLLDSIHNTSRGNKKKVLHKILDIPKWMKYIF